MLSATQDHSLALLAPVPCVHMEAALQACRDTGLVAFGTGKKSLFVDLDECPLIGPGLPVLVYVSQTGITTGKEAGASYLRGPIVSYEGTFAKWRAADRQGRHPDQAVRPITTGDDTAWMGFFEVADLQPCKVPLSALTWNSGGKSVTSPPRGPDLVRR